VFDSMRSHLERQLEEIRTAGLEKHERVLTGPQGAVVSVLNREVLNLCANNYLGLADDPALVSAAKEALDRWGYGLASVRFICGTQEIHKELEAALTDFLGTEDTILYSSCFDANGGIFEALLGEQDAILTDELNHASIIDGVRLSKARRLRYAHGDLDALERALTDAADARIKCIVTDGVFSMDGDYAPLEGICALANAHGALVMVDDSHATGFVGPTGRGTPERAGVIDQVDIVTSTLGKALGGASGGFVAAHQEIVDLLRQRARPYLFSNSIAPPIVAASIAAIEIARSSTELRDKLMANAARFRSAMTDAGFTIAVGDHPIVPIILGDAALAARVADLLLAEGIYVVGFSYPVVARGKARIRVQLSGAHTTEQIDEAVAAFVSVATRLGILA
jgi:glycine C-acetyltransferase